MVVRRIEKLIAKGCGFLVLEVLGAREEVSWVDARFEAVKSFLSTAV